MRERMERLDEFMKVKQLNDYQVTNMCGLSTGLLSKARAGKSDIGMAACNKILDKFGDLNRAWLLWGEGDMFNPSQVDYSQTDIYKHLDNILLNTSQIREMIGYISEREKQRTTLLHKLEEMKTDFRSSICILLCLQLIEVVILVILYWHFSM